MTKLKEKFLEDYSIATLRDSDLTGLSTNSIILFNSGSGKWEPHKIQKKYYESLSVSSTTSATPQDKINVTTPSLIAGDYLFKYFASYGNSKKSRETHVHVLINGVHYSEVVTGMVKDNDYIVYSGMKKLTLPVGTVQLQMQFSADTGSTNTAMIKDASFYFERIIGEI